MDQASLKELFVYNHTCNDKFIQVFIQHSEQINERCFKLFSHVLNAQAIWNSRLDQSLVSRGVWDIIPVDQLQTIDRINQTNTEGILNKIDTSLTVHYKNTKGEVFSNTVGDVLFHVFNHSNYHRAQVASELKQLGIDPPATDYIFYKREKI